MTDENTKTWRSVADCLPSDFAFRAYEHFAKALRKHPRFADALFVPTRTPYDADYGEMCEWAQSILVDERAELAAAEARHIVSAMKLLDCEMAEARFECVQGNTAATVDELYDAVAVLMRMIAVVEGKQRLEGEDMKATDCKHVLACQEHDFHDGGADADQCLVDCELMGEFMEIGFDCGKGHCRLYERREEANA